MKYDKHMDQLEKRTKRLRGAVLATAYRLGADLRGAYLEHAYLLGADLEGANLKGVKYRRGLTGVKNLPELSAG